jgi:hypothetical protein
VTPAGGPPVPTGSRSPASEPDAAALIAGTGAVSLVRAAALPQNVVLVESSWSRGDPRHVDSEGYGKALEAGRTVYVAFVTRKDQYDEIAQSCLAERVPVHRLDVAGQTILLIYRVRGPAGCGSA